MTINTTDSAITRNGVVELDEAALERAAGGASDYLLEIDGIKGESQQKPPRRTAGANVLLMDGSVR